MSEAKGIIPAPNINVTPLIDVLLVLLIIFMVAAPLKPHRFLANLPSEPPQKTDLPPDPLGLVVTIQSDRTLKLNDVTGLGTVDDVTPLNLKLKAVFDERLRNRAYRSDLVTRTELSEFERIQKTVFIKAPRTITYGEVMRVVDGLKGSGAQPIGLQLDNLN